MDDHKNTDYKTNIGYRIGQGINTGILYCLIGLASVGFGSGCSASLAYKSREIGNLSRMTNQSEDVIAGYKNRMKKARTGIGITHDENAVHPSGYDVDVVKQNAETYIENITELTAEVNKEGKENRDEWRQIGNSLVEDNLLAVRDVLKDINGYRLVGGEDLTDLIGKYDMALEQFYSLRATIEGRDKAEARADSGLAALLAFPKDYAPPRSDKAGRAEFWQDFGRFDEIREKRNVLGINQDLSRETIEDILPGFRKDIERANQTRGVYKKRAFWAGFWTTVAGILGYQIQYWGDHGGDSKGDIGGEQGGPGGR